jgi:hypothetical protein
VSRSRFVKWGWVGPAVLVSGTLLFAPRVWQRRDQAVPASSVSVRNVVNVPAKVAETVSVPEAAPSPSAVVPGASTSRAAETKKTVSRTRDGLAEEVALLSRAETELRAGRPAKALLALAEHQRKFPRGALAEERTAARIQALCALGLRDEANAQLAQLLHISPSSAHEGRARQACRDLRPAPP